MLLSPPSMWLARSFPQPLAKLPCHCHQLRVRPQESQAPPRMKMGAGAFPIELTGSVWGWLGWGIGSRWPWHKGSATASALVLGVLHRSSTGAQQSCMGEAVRIRR